LIAYRTHPPNADDRIAEPDLVGSDKVEECELTGFGHQARTAEIL
jgi:hypothetical protein